MKGPAPTDRLRLVHLAVHDTAVRFALAFAVDAAGWSRAPSPVGDAVVVGDWVTDRPDAPPLDVLVLRPSPAASRRGLDAFTAGKVRSVVSSTDPGALPGALESARRGFSVVSREIVDAAQGFPELTPRLEHTLHLVVRGRANRDIARELRQSEATTKRDVGELLRRFDAANRVALAATALRLGLRIDPRT